MAYKALYRKYRPTSFEDVVGQDHIVKALNQSLAQNKIAHAYLFCGTRGTGKTSIAKIFAKAINCLNPSEAPCNKCANCIESDKGINQDIVEMDAASNNGVDEIRNLIEQVKYAPLQSKYKVYIIDEVHMLTKNAFNALLKTLEEPPGHVVFILATTEAHKVLPTVVSRCQRYDFLRVDKGSIVKRLAHVAQQENVEIDLESKQAIAYLAEGGMRDALSILDQCLAYSEDKVTIQDIKEIYGLVSTKDKIELVKQIENKDVKNVLTSLSEFNIRGIDFRRLTNDFINLFKESLMYMYTSDNTILETLSDDEAKEVLNLYNETNLISMIDILMSVSESFRYATNIYNYFEVACLKLMNVKATKTQVEFNSSEKIDVVKKEVQKEEVKQESIKIEKPKETIKVVEEPDHTEEDIVQPSLEIHEEEPKQEEPAIVKYDSETLLSLVVQCTRDHRAKDEAIFNTLNNYRHDLSLIKYINLLNKTKIAASGNDCILVMSQHEAIVNNINEPTMNKEIYEFMLNKINVDKMVYALSEDQYQEVLTLYKERVGEGNLPKPLKVERYKFEKEEKEEMTIENKLFEVFGKDNVEIILEEEN